MVVKGMESGISGATCVAGSSQVEDFFASIETVRSHVMTAVRFTRGGINR
jgi:hypothetical protein